MDNADNPDQPDTAEAPFDPVAFAALVADPARIPVLRAIQKQAHALLDQAVNDLIAALGQTEPLQTLGRQTGVTDVRALATASRSSTSAAADRRKFARDIIISGMLNRKNDEWDMTDASTYQSETRDPIVALLRMPML
ncbi:hypothetical protein [Actimicrobium sp. CCI2.3]|uniref:hypothetical protein n=1 Tax=Actimicrobium sp. CCI2.3 TaxID=3048616 RepID=UPI002AB56E7F|nr:hypothetical protein [Actimicrobium sp. CCI2.3]MDY7572890.1 hypothetical protein [Actimicrobium sp. CCI2.3]MEB0020735.1 hypothetical protein [Actimicrobium sp. CCI2.3]